MGSFVENHLLPGEKVEVAGVISWWSQAPHFLFSLIPPFVFGLVLIPIAIINVVTTELAVTNKKIIGKTGWLRRISLDIPLNKLESINIDQSFIGRILNYGTIIIRGTGGTSVKIPYIKDPLDFRRAAMTILDHKQAM